MKGHHKSKISAWLYAARLRTLPLAVSGIVAGNMLARYFGKFDPLIFVLSLLTALWLQILSNLANDYGDYTKGTDNDARIGPARAMQSGKISARSMKTGMVICILLALGSGVPLVILGTRNLDWFTGLFFLLLGLLGIAAAIFYTIGKNAYGYRGLGDLFVFLFFGIVAVTGSFYLQYKTLLFQILFPATSIGLFSVGVLNMNNLRDMQNDQQAGKITLAVRLGKKGTIIYQFLLMLTGAFFALYFHFIFIPSIHYLYLFSLILIIPHLYQVVKYQHPQQLDKQLKGVVFITLLYALGLSFSLLLHLDL
ncbi:MAG: 1,4-dihydroxy-2-naphthoate octaprenyltransferase [Flavobacteriales bacterium]|nr:1,4-dihydroxy-2-naphthoate octaprenyltransferase [Flavobacteriales bacterium]